LLGVPLPLLLLIVVSLLISPSLIYAQALPSGNNNNNPTPNTAVAANIFISTKSAAVITAAAASPSSSQSIEKEEQNKAIILAFIQATNDRNYTAIEKYVAVNITEHRPGVASGRNSTIHFIKGLTIAFPDFKTSVDHIIAEGDKVVVFTTTNGTHKGPFLFAPNIPPSGKQVSFRTADIYRISNSTGQIVEHWDIIEILDLMRQIGAISSSQPSSSSSVLPLTL
jgi:predicted ester cyclase